MIYLLRHTRPKIEAGICYGVSDLELDPDSCSMEIAQTVEKLKELSFAKIYSSPLKRCRQLAEAICSAKDEIIFDSRLMEMNFGDWEMAEWNEIFEKEEGKRWFADYINYPTPNGESMNDLVERARSFLGELKGCQKQGDILIVTHAGFIRSAMVASGVATHSEIFDLSIEYGELKSLNISTRK